MKFFSRPAQPGTNPAASSPHTVRLFIKPYCGWCHAAMDWLDHRGIRYEVLDVIGNASAYREMEQLSGQTYAPVIDVNGHVLADFGPDELAAFWKTLGDPPRSASSGSGGSPHI